MWRLILNLGKANEQEFPLTEGSFKIGRSHDTEVHVPHRSLSRVHARLDVDRDGVVLHDLDSKNKTLVDGVPVDRCRLRGGESIRCGNISFTFLSDNSGPTLALPPPRRDQLDVNALNIGQLLEGGGETPATALRLTMAGARSRTLAKLRILLKVSQLLTSTPSVVELLEKILDLAFELLDIDRSALLIADGETGELEERLTRIRPGIDHGERIHSERIVRQVINSATPVLFADVHDDPRLVPSPSIVGQSICSAMGVPLMSREQQILGVLYVDNVTRPGRFNNEDLEFLAAFASQAALAIENSGLQARLERQAVQRNNMLRFFPPTIVDQMEETGTSLLDVIETEVTVLFADIASYTKLSSEMEPRRVVEMLNRYLPMMTDIVFQFDGTLEKYIGDALMAVWGAPLGTADDADRAVRAAVAMQRGLIELNRDRGDFPELHIHIGLNTGSVAAGNIGSRRYLQYATIGDATNVASRVCSVARAGEVLLTEATLLKLGDREETVRNETVRLPPIQVKGKDQPLDLYRLNWRALA